MTEHKCSEEKPHKEKIIPLNPLSQCGANEEQDDPYDAQETLNKLSDVMLGRNTTKKNKTLHEYLKANGIRSIQWKEGGVERTKKYLRDKGVIE